jgi:hypothetical protein
MPELAAEFVEGAWWELDCLARELYPPERRQGPWLTKRQKEQVAREADRRRRLDAARWERPADRPSIDLEALAARDHRRVAFTPPRGRS